MVKKNYATIEDIKRIMLKPWKIIGASILTVISLLFYYKLTFWYFNEIVYPAFINWLFLWAFFVIGGIFIFLILSTVWNIKLNFKKIEEFFNE